MNLYPAKQFRQLRSEWKHPFAGFIVTPLCGTCKLAERMLDIIVTMRPEWLIYKLNINEIPDLAIRWKIANVPCLIFFRNGAPVDIHFSLSSIDAIFRELTAFFNETSNQIHGGRDNMSTESANWIPGTAVRVEYKTGEYVAELLEVAPPKALVKIMAVLKHPTQGDLHDMYNPNALMFHQRKALAYQEKARVFLRDVQSYENPVPDYGTSLKEALDREIEQLTRLEQWAAKSLKELGSLKEDYFRG